MPQILTTNIYYSKTAYGLGLFATIITFFVGIALLTVIQNNALNFTVHPFSKFGALGVVLMIASVLVARVYLKKLSITSPAIIINNEGITLNDENPLFISWDAIDHIEILEVTNSADYSKSKYIVPVLKDPETYFNGLTKKLFGTLQKWKIKTNSAQPIRISTNFLRCSFKELQSILEKNLDTSKADRVA